MAYHSDTQLALDDLVFLGLHRSLAKSEPANEPLQHGHGEASSDPEEAECWLRWMKISLGCETG